MFELTNRQKLDQIAKRYILSTIEYDLENNPIKTVTEKRVYLIAREKEFTYKSKRVGRQRACTDWLQGVSLNIEYMNGAILELAKEWGSLPQHPTEKQEENILDNYWSFMASKVCQIIDGYHVPKETTQMRCT